jgi:putative addiction module component (TIGR02574 family)
MEAAAKSLSREERERLVSDLLAGLDDAPLSEIDLAWIEEAERRYDAWKAGQAEAVPAREAVEEIRRSLGK